MKSYHRFMFPFRFDFVNEEFNDRHEFYKNIQFDERVNNKLEHLFELLNKNDWEYKPFKFDKGKKYNEFVYFHDFVKDTLFNLDEKPQKNATSWFFKKKFKDGKYIIKSNKTYELKLKSITLRLFDSGIGILVFECENYKYFDFKDILNINELGRRVYPPFVYDDFTIGGVNSIISEEIIVRLDDKLYKADFKEEFKVLKSNTPFVKVSKIILNILGDYIFSQKLEKGKFLLQPIIDDRMFVMCWYGNNALANAIATDKNYKLNDSWYKFVFIDTTYPTVQDDDMKEDLLKKATYTRWKNYKTLYGISRYSFMLLSYDLDGLRRNMVDYIITHFQTIYFQLVSLVLAIRASILRFSDEVTAISDLPQKELYERMSSLYKNYLRFVNKLYFKEISPQDQGVELYEKMIENMKIDRDIIDLDREISKLNSYVSLIEEKEENKDMKKLTQVATYLLPPSIVAGFFGMNVFGEGLKIPNQTAFGVSLFIIFISFVFAPLVIKIIDYFQSIKNKLKKFKF